MDSGLVVLFFPAVSGCSSTAEQQTAFAIAQLEQRQAMIKPLLRLECGDTPCQFQALEVHSEIVQQQALAQPITLPESTGQTLIKELGLTTRSLVSTAAQTASSAAPLYFMADIAKTGIQSAGDVIDNTHDPVVV